MTFNEVRKYVTNLLKASFVNKGVLDKLSESDTGKLLYNGSSLGDENGSAGDTGWLEKTIDGGGRNSNVKYRCCNQVVDVYIRVFLTDWHIQASPNLTTIASIPPEYLPKNQITGVAATRYSNADGTSNNYPPKFYVCLGNKDNYVAHPEWINIFISPIDNQDSTFTGIIDFHCSYLKD